MANTDKLDIPTERFCGVWHTLVDIFEGSLLSPSSPPETMKIEELDIDEHFDISLLNVIQKDIVIHLGQPRVPADIIEKLVHVIRESSRLYTDTNTDLEDAEVKSDVIGTTSAVVPVMKESFAYASFMALFNLCSSEEKGKSVDTRHALI